MLGNTVIHCFFSVWLSFTTKLRFRVRNKVWFKCSPVLYRLASQRLSLKTESKIEFLGPFSGRRKVLV